MRLLPVIVTALLLSACRTPPLPTVDPASRATLLRLDANADGTITRAELDAGLASAFTAADTNRDGRLDTAEINAINDARWNSDASRTSPIQDWNLDGIVDAREFGTEIRSLFEALDNDRNGQVTPAELSPPQPARPNARPGGPQVGPGGQPPPR